jgi:hypothetical protein
MRARRPSSRLGSGRSQPRPTSPTPVVRCGEIPSDAFVLSCVKSAMRCRDLVLFTGVTLLMGCSGLHQYSGFGLGIGDAVSQGVGQGITSSAVSRASGGCFAQCPASTKCSEASGLCEEVPCRGGCPPTEHCEDDGRCAPGAKGAQGVIQRHDVPGNDQVMLRRFEVSSPPSGTSVR